MIKDDQGNEEAKDNRSILDDTKAQKMTADDIEAMKKQGAKGQEIIKELISNSESWNKRTKFSQ